MANQDSEITLYNGRYTAIFKNSSHRYYIDGQLKSGVTTIMSKVLAKPGLMLWPLNMALTHLKTKIPTITEADLEEAAKAHIKKRDAGADIGTIVHSLAETILLDGVINFDDYSDEVTKTTYAFQDWRDSCSPLTVAVEQVVYSPTFNYAGTFDSILRIKDKTYLCDLKTTNASKEAPLGIYADHFIQLGGYLLAYDEQRTWEEKNGGTKLSVIDDLMIISCKKNGKVDTVIASDVGLTPDDCINMWKFTLQLCRLLEQTKKRLGEKNG